MSELDQIAADLSEIDGLEIERDAPAGPLCTYRVGGPLNVLCQVETADALAEMAERLSTIAGRGLAVSTLPIGKGSNLLVSDRGFDGIAFVLTGEFTEIAVTDTTVVAGASAPLPLVARASVRHGLTDFEWAVGVPGTIGGGVRMNAGGHGSDMAANLVSAEVVDLTTGEFSTRSAVDLELGYRTSNIELHELVTSATLELKPASAGDTAQDNAAQSAGDTAQGDAAQSAGDAAQSADDAALNAGDTALSDIVKWRRANQPGGQNAGSVFTNPENDSAGRLIDAAGLKGYRVGTAEVSTVHANFIQVDPSGSADDVMALMREIVAKVHGESGIRLHAETRLLGFPDADVHDVQARGNSEKDGAL